MDKKIKYWILSAISQADKKTIGVNELFDQKPGFFTGDLTKLFKYLLELEGDDLILFDRESDDPSFRLTERGQKDLEEYLKTANIKEVFGNNSQ